MSGPGDNICLLTDSYKMTHWKMYPPKTEVVYSYLEARSGGEYSETTFFGLQYLLQRYLQDVVVTPDKILEAAEHCQKHFGQDLFNHEGWTHIVNEHDGRLPVLIKAVPEGTVVSEGNILLSIENTCPECAWLTNHLETLLVQLWYPCTVATISSAQRKVLQGGLEKSGDMAKLPYMLHDFGYRGSTSVESAAIGGAAHLVNFVGTDTMAALQFVREYYDCEMAGFSVPAAEHSTITAWGQEREVDAYRHILEQYPSGIVSVVSDSWDVYRACSVLWGSILRDEIRYNGSRTLVIRPDSGDPCEVIPTCLNILGGKFGRSKNQKGYWELPPYLRVIQGDGISRFSLPKITQAIMDQGWSLNNLVFGSGGGLLQDCNRDTLRFAMKCASVTIDGEERDVYKNPLTDPGKASKRGRQKLILTSQGYRTVGQLEFGHDLLRSVFADGYVLLHQRFEDIRS